MTKIWQNCQFWGTLIKPFQIFLRLHCLLAAIIVLQIILIWKNPFCMYQYPASYSSCNFINVEFLFQLEIDDLSRSVFL